MRSTETDNQLVQHYAKVKAFCLHLCKNKDDAEDLLQTVFLKALSMGLKSDSGIKSWLYTIAKNQFINDYRRNKNNPVVTFETINCNSFVDYQQHQIDAGFYWDKINSLTPRYKSVITMFAQGYKYREIADHLDITTGGVRSELHFARTKLGKLKTNKL